uniref:Disease resistance R13L4/SHOC-2-like LRR domain-containing protein n=1 Tax=Vitis vinifera TaxID=29760 RepID=A5B1C1_VITVI|nr:hypothetical protein VITISV_025634 [Vitis vinifera]
MKYQRYYDEKLRHFKPWWKDIRKCWNDFSFRRAIQLKNVTALRAVKKRLIDPMKNIRNWGKGDPYFLWNDLSGSIPKEIGNIAPLRLLLLSGNRLSGSLPDELGYLSHLDRLQIDENQISGLVPKSFANLSRIKHLHMNNNSLSGRIPSELSNASTLRHLLFDNNNLSGNLPPELSHLPELRILQLDNNNFSGAEIPISYGNLSNLVKFAPFMLLNFAAGLNMSS